MLRELAKYIEQETTLEINVSLYVGFLHSGAHTECVCIYDRTGARLDFTGVVTEHPIQFFSRAESYDVARRLGLTMHDLFCGQGKAGIDLPVFVSGESYFINSAEHINGPYYVGEDTANSHQFMTNILFRVTRR